ncbi:MAG TPA: glycoside hydrolase family 3 N-terminal domain-containing protein [Gemmatimonadaceae bacterium]|nr:glycoside hydrolase family 3 N-terminal domain-containing protein [Gemmatimonadaceae bacterium]
MLRGFALAAVAGALVAASAAAQTREPPFASAAASRFADSVLALMTLEEKLGQLAQAPGYGTQSGPRVSAGSQAQLRAGKLGSFLGVFGAGYTRELQRIAVEETRLGIPLLFAWDIIHGHRTIYPIPLAEAASFNPERVEQSARFAAIEATAHGLHWTFAPMVDIARDPRWGRISEGAGEDTHLGNVMAAAKVRGFQGGDNGGDYSAPNTMLATAKHFAAYGAPEGGRDYNTVELSERALWDVFLPPFEAAVKTGVATIMSAFHDIGGVPATASDWLLGDVLRKRWGFRGVVISDWGSINELRQHGVAGNRVDAGMLALRAGVDIDMASNIYSDSLAPAVSVGRVSQSFVDSSTHRVLRLKYALGLFQDPYRYSDSAREARYTLAPEHVAAARQAAREGIVLLKNDNATLPLRKDLASIAVIGPLADDAVSALGNWAAAGRREDAVTLLAGIRTALPVQARILYARGTPVDTPTTAGFAEAERVAIEAEAVVFVLGERQDMSGEAASRAFVELPGAQLSLVQTISRAVRRAPGGDKKPMVVVLMNGRPLAIPELVAETPAILETWFLGVQHGHAAADVIFGDYNPGGKLPATFPRATGQIPLYYGHRNTGRPPNAREKYTSKYLDVRWTPLFPFGYGLSYTTFAHSNLRVSVSRNPTAVVPTADSAASVIDSTRVPVRDSTPSIRAGDSVYVQVDVTNTGARAGDEVVQVYVRDDVASVAQPLRSLQAFRRVNLAPGEKRTVTLALGPEALALYDRSMRRIVEPGAFTIFVGTDSDAPLSAKLQVTGPTAILAPAPPRFR